MHAQSHEQVVRIQQEQALLHATRLINANKNDSALSYLQPTLDQLTANDLLDSPFGLKVQLAKGQTLEQQHHNTAAMTLLLELSDKSQAAGQWNTYARTNLTLGRLYEKMHRAEESWNSLESANTTIAQQQLDSLYPSLYIRRAFWYQSFGHPDSVRLYSAKALNVNKMNENPIIQYSLMVLKGNDLAEEDYLAGIGYYKEAAKIARDIEDYTRLSFVLHIISKSYMINYDYLNSLTYNDSTIQACYQAIVEGNDRIFTLNDAYLDRAFIFKSKGQLDSALHYTKRGFSQELTFVKQQEYARVAEIDARFKNEKKSLQIQQLAKEVQQEKRTRLFAAFSAFLILAFGCILAYYYLQLRRLNKKTKEQAERLRNLDVAKSHFFANVSHELRTPLTLMLGPVKTLLKSRRSPEKQELLLNIVLQNGLHLQQLVNEILDLRKLEMGKMELNLQATNLASFFKQYASQFESLKVAGEIDFSYETTIETEVTAMIDREKCRQVLYNLLSNAFKFTPAKGRISAKLSLDDNLLTLEVADTGAGIHPDDLPLVFDRFFQISRPDTPVQGGTGIGLALCKEYIHLFGGKIEVKSPGPEGKGSVFRAVFPIALTESPEETIEPWKSTTAAPSLESLQNAQSANPADDARPSVLVVEDNLDLQAYIRVVLEEKYQITTAGNGKEALRCLEEMANCKLILSDLMMPVMDGYQFLEKLKSGDATRHIPVIMLSARAEARDKLKALRIGVDDYLTKPFDEEELLARIANLLKNQAARRMAPPAEPGQKTSEPILSQADQEWLAAFEVYVGKNSSSDILSIPMLAQEFAMSESTLLRQLKRLTGLSPQQYLLEMRLDKARSVLEENSGSSLAKIASEAGYSDIRTFSRSFRQRFGKLPSELLGK